jgi:hypothetical protein
MKLYSITDMTHLLQELLHTKNFGTIASATLRKGEIEAVQFDASGTVSQRFLIKVENTPEE